MRTYRCGDLHLGELRRGRGLRVGATIAEALALWANRGEYGTAWPPRVFEGTVDAEDILSTEAHALNARAMRIERELPFAEVFGARAEDLARFVDDVAKTPWLRPSAHTDVEGKIAELVAEHYLALSDYGTVTALPVRLLRTWHAARDVYDQLELRPEAETAALDVATAESKEATTRVALRVAHAKVARLAFFGAWDASWAEAGRSASTGANAVNWLRGVPEGNEHYLIATATRAVEDLLDALDAARAPARKAGWNAAYETFVGIRHELPELNVIFAPAVAAAQTAVAQGSPMRPIHDPGCAICASIPRGRAAHIREFTGHTCFTAWVLAGKAAQNALTRADYLVNAVPQADPWRPLLDIWRLGAWPLGATKRSFLVFLPMPRS